MSENSFFGRFASGYYDVECQLDYYLRRKAEECLRRQKEMKENIYTLEQVEERKESIKKSFLYAIGGLDIERTPLEASCTGVIHREGYEIRKIIFQSQPGFYVTANLYLPQREEKKYPAVLMACGHTDLGKAAPPYQKVCIDLVKNGFIVLIVDPTGQGERMNFYDPETGRSLIRAGTTEHAYLGLQCQLAGTSIDRYFIWDLMRALDYLCTLPEVDPDRIGMTGNSGGGGQTCRMLMLDPRIQVGASCCYTFCQEERIKTPLIFDGERNTHSAVSTGLNDDDFFTCFVPKPVLLGAAASDYFGLDGVLTSYERVKKIYELYQCPEKAQLVVGQGNHGFSDTLREAVVHWFVLHLKGEISAFKTDKDMKTEEERTLWCTERGQILGHYGDARGIQALNGEFMKKHRYPPAEDVEEVKKRVAEVLSMPVTGKPILPRVVASRKEGNRQYQSIVFFSEEDILVDGVYISRSGKTAKQCTLLLLENGTLEIPLRTLFIEKLLEEADVLVFDPRGVGASRSRDLSTGGYSCMFGTEHRLNQDANLLGISLLGMRIFDVLRAHLFLEQFHPGMEIRLAGCGLGAVYGVFSAVFLDSVKNVYLENGLPSFESLVKEKMYSYHPVYDVFGILRQVDIPMILQSLASGKSIRWVNLPQVHPELLVKNYYGEKW